MNSSDKKILELLRKLEPEQLHVWLAGYAGSNHVFKNDLLVHFMPGKSLTSKNHYQELVADCFSDSHQSSGYSRDFYDDAGEKTASELESLLDKANAYCSINNMEEAVAIAQSIIEAIPRNYGEVDDSNGALSEVFDSAIERLQEIAGNKAASQNLKKDILQWVKHESKEKVYEECGFDSIPFLLVPYTLATGTPQDALSIVDDRIFKASTDYDKELPYWKRSYC